jgi:hypothetical protein
LKGCYLHAMVSTSRMLLSVRSFKVTGPVALLQVIRKGVPTLMPEKAELVNKTALATAKAAEAMRNLENCMLILIRL